MVDDEQRKGKAEGRGEGERTVRVVKGRPDGVTVFRRRVLHARDTNTNSLTFGDTLAHTNI